MSIIPKNIFQTHKSINYLRSKPQLLAATKTWSKYSTEFNYYFYTNELCDKFMREQFSGATYDAYKKLPIAVMKADLWRYCILYKYGGLYADVDTILKVNPNIFLTNSFLTVVPENETHLCQWVFSAPANSPILKSIIDLSVERILNTKEIKGEHIIHYLTGPGVFTDGIEKYLINVKKPIFSNKKNYYRYPHNIIKVFNYNNFHNNIVKHLFAGQNNDGWFHERYNKLL